MIPVKIVKNYCKCRPPKVREGKRQMRRGDECLNCGLEIQRISETRSGKILKLTIANQSHDCRGCNSIMDEGELYWRLLDPNPDDRGTWHTWGLCYNCRIENIEFLKRLNL
jgi:hypothetical protein